MKQDRETKNQLLASARGEFREKGYFKASLRNICKNAGVTTGALYFFFQDKEDLFDAVVGDTVKELWQIMDLHFQNKGEDGSADEKMQEGFATAEGIIHRIYLQREDVLLLLTKSQGSRYENIADQFIEKAEANYRRRAEAMESAYPDIRIDDKFLHWIAHEQIEVFSYAITHIDEEERAVQFITQAIAYMRAGWYGVFER